MLATGLYEIEATYLMWRLARRGGTLIDVGANHGYYTCLWTAMRADNHVLAVEASPRCLPALRRNVSGNGLDSVVKVLPYAAGAEAGRMAFDLGPEDQTGWGGLGGQGGRRYTLIGPDKMVEMRFGM